MERTAIWWLAVFVLYHDVWQKKEACQLLRLYVESVPKVLMIWAPPKKEKYEHK